MQRSTMVSASEGRGRAVVRLEAVAFRAAQAGVSRGRCPLRRAAAPASLHTIGPGGTRNETFDGRYGPACWARVSAPGSRGQFVNLLRVLKERHPEARRF